MIFLGICRGHAGDLPDPKAESAALREAPHAAARAAAEAQGGSGLSEQSEEQPREAGWRYGVVRLVRQWQEDVEDMEDWKKPGVIGGWFLDSIIWDGPRLGFLPL